MMDAAQLEQEAVATRAYQLEMFEKSMQSNIIATMDTGSGKTWIAKLRIEAELRRTPSKIVWFTAPSVVLAEQQYKYLSRHLTPFSTRLITGADNTHLWSTQEVWDAILDVCLVVSTPQVLLEGLERGFLEMQRISLLVIDEAHHCIERHPSNVTMQSFYHELRRTNSTIELPYILGLTASPVTTKLANLDILERNLGAVCMTPTRQIEEYREHVHLPEIVTLDYAAPESCESCESLPIQLTLRILDSVDINKDPWVKHLLEDNKPDALRKLSKVLISRKTFCMEQLKKLRSNTEHLYTQLGAWATNTWLKEVLTKLHSTVQSRCWLSNISEEEHRYLDKSLAEIRELTIRAIEEGSITCQLSSKSECLVRFLRGEYAKDANTSCVIFVERRSTAFALTKLLQNHPYVGCTVSSFVGGSNFSKKANLIDLADLATQKTELEEFRSGLRSIVVATAVMEEGIDIQATNLVIRWDNALTLRSWVQSRGRARKVASKFVVMNCVEEVTSNKKKYTDWMSLEADVQAAYTDEIRQLQSTLKLEEEDEDEKTGWGYTVSSTGARLTFENARNLLEHCCTSFSKTQFLNSRPIFICQGVHGSDISAKVILPSSLSAELREFSGRGVWRTEKRAKRDAAFEAVKKLHESGLLNDHLLPPALPKLDSFSVETRAAFANIRPQTNPWPSIATHFDANVLLHVYRFKLDDMPQCRPQSSLLLLLPTKLKSGVNVPLHYTRTETFQARVLFVETRVTCGASRELAQEVTSFLLRTSLVSQSTDPETWKQGFPFYILPDVPEVDLRGWFDLCRESYSLTNLLEQPSSPCTPYYALKHAAVPGIYISNLERSTLIPRKFVLALPEAIPAVLAKKIPRRIDYLTAGIAPFSMTGQLSTLPIDKCMVIDITPSIIEIMQFLPSVIRVIGFALVSEMCCRALLRHFGIEDTMLLTEALTSPLAYGHANYERLEFFGDTLLKLYACLQVFADPQNSLLPEAYLTMEAMKLVNNGRLHRAAIELGLDVFMIHEQFHPKAWKPETNISQSMQSNRNPSTKIIADHVEAIIAVAYLDDSCTNGKDSKAIAFLNAALPEIQWRLPNVNAATVSAHSPETPLSFEGLSVVESILGYNFRQRHLLAEALNHSSVLSDLRTYGRLEFLGDAVLQRIVNEAVYAAPARYSQNAMHLRQIACVSHSYLAWLCFEAHQEVERVDVSTDLVHENAVLKRTTETKYLFEFMMHSNPEIAPAQQRSLKRYIAQAERIKTELEQSKTYPWALLASIAAPKFFSDIIESVLAAVYIDSGADLAVCSRVLAKLGLMELLRRLVDEPDMVLAQPKTILWEERAKAGLPALKAVSRSRVERDGRRYNCQLLLEGEVYAEVDDAFCEEEAVLTVCEVGLERFRSEQEAKTMAEGNAQPMVGVSEGVAAQLKRKRHNSLPSAIDGMMSADE